MKIVKFRDGSFGIRRRLMSRFWAPQFFDFVAMRSKDHYWWSMTSPHLPDCRVEDESEARRVYDIYTDIGTPIE